MDGWDCHPKVKNSDPQLFRSNTTSDQKNEKIRMGKAVQWPEQIGILLMGGLQGLTLLLILQCAYRAEPSKAASWEDQQAAD